MKPLGVSVVVCCHNGAKRLPQTLAYLSMQQVVGNLSWEVIVVDNASTDKTSQIASASWPDNAPCPLRVVCEPRLGLSYARQHGFAESNFEVVSFIDDDNWVCADWIQFVSEIMSQHPAIGACGGYSEAVSEIEVPQWFDRYKESYAIGTQGEQAGDITWTRGYLWGAGLSIRKLAWEGLIQKGFRPLLMGRQGTRLTSGEDCELCFALRLAGWRLWYDPRLRLQHFIPAHRLEWNELRRRRRGSGAASVECDAYLVGIDNKNHGLKALWRKRSWQWQVFLTLLSLFYSLSRLFLSLLLLLLLHNAFGRDLRVAQEILNVESKGARLLGLLKKYRVYQSNMLAVWNASWRQAVNRSA